MLRFLTCIWLLWILDVSANAGERTRKSNSLVVNPRNHPTQVILYRVRRIAAPSLVDWKNVESETNAVTFTVVRIESDFVVCETMPGVAPLKILPADPSSFNYSCTPIVNRPHSIIRRRMQANCQKNGKCSPTSTPTLPPTTTAPSTASPTSTPTTSTPTVTPSQHPTSNPSPMPTRAPSRSPTPAPTPAPSHAPSSAPSTNPTSSPSQAPSHTPSSAPTYPTTNPTDAPTVSPSTLPTFIPTVIPTAAPSSTPSLLPTYVPTRSPTSYCGFRGFFDKVDTGNFPFDFFMGQCCPRSYLGCDTSNKIVKVNLTSALTLKGSLDIDFLPITVSQIYIHNLESNLIVLVDQTQLSHVKVLSLEVKNCPWVTDFNFAELPPTLVELRLSGKCSGKVNLTALPPTLEVLDLSGNGRFDGSIELTSLPKGLRVLDLSDNSFSGSLDLSNLPSSLEYLAVDNNDLEGPIDFLSLPSNLTFIADTKVYCGGRHCASDAPLAVVSDRRTDKRCVGANGCSATCSLPCYAKELISEARQLFAAFANVNGLPPSWTKSSGKANPCEPDANWTGVACSPDRQHITSVVLPDSNLTGSLDVGKLPPEIGVLNLSRNDLTGKLSFEDADVLLGLTAVDLRGNNFAQNKISFLPFGTRDVLVGLDVRIFCASVSAKCAGVDPKDLRRSSALCTAANDCIAGCKCPDASLELLLSDTVKDLWLYVVIAVGGGCLISFSLSLLLYWILRGCCQRVGSGSPDYGDIIIVWLNSADFYTDVLFALVRGIQVHNDTVYRRGYLPTIFYLSVACLVIPYCLSMITLFYQLNYQWKRNGTERVKLWLDRFEKPLVILCALLGSPYAGILFVTSRAFPIEFFCWDLPKFSRMQVGKYRMYTSVLCENVPQLGIQLAFLVYSNGQIDMIALFSMLFTLMSIVVAILVECNQYCSKKSDTHNYSEVDAMSFAGTEFDVHLTFDPFANWYSYLADDAYRRALSGLFSDFAITRFHFKQIIVKRRVQKIILTVFAYDQYHELYFLLQDKDKEFSHNTGLERNIRQELGLEGTLSVQIIFDTVKRQSENRNLQDKDTRDFQLNIRNGSQLFLSMLLNLAHGGLVAWSILVGWDLKWIIVPSIITFVLPLLPFIQLWSSFAGQDCGLMFSVVTLGLVSGNIGSASNVLLSEDSKFRAHAAIVQGDADVLLLPRLWVYSWVYTQTGHFGAVALASLLFLMFAHKRTCVEHNISKVTPDSGTRATSRSKPERPAMVRLPSLSDTHSKGLLSPSSVSGIPNFELGERRDPDVAVASVNEILQVLEQRIGLPGSEKRAEVLKKIESVVKYTSFERRREEESSPQREAVENEPFPPVPVVIGDFEQRSSEQLVMPGLPPPPVPPEE